MEEHKERNVLFLGAAILTVGLFIEFLKEKVLGLELNVIYKTLIIMFMIAVGYSFGAKLINPLVKHFLNRLNDKFVNKLGGLGGNLVFYLIIYGVLFGLYLVVYVYGIQITSFPEKLVQLPNITLIK